MTIKTWRPYPLDLTIVEVLEKKGTMTDRVVQFAQRDVGNWGSLTSTRHL